MKKKRIDLGGSQGNPQDVVLVGYAGKQKFEYDKEKKLSVEKLKNGCKISWR